MTHNKYGCNDKMTEEQFYEDLSWIGQMPRGYVVKETFEKWKDRIRFDGGTKHLKNDKRK